MKYSEAIQSLKRETWLTLDEGAKIECLQAVEIEFAKREGRESAPVLSVDFDAKSHISHSKDIETIFVNYDSLMTPSNHPLSFVEGVMHMSRHVYQKRLVEGKEKSSIPELGEACRKDFSEQKIDRHKNPKARHFQLSEVDARRYASETLGKVIIEMERPVEKAPSSLSDRVKGLQADSPVKVDIPKKPPTLPER